MAGLTMKLDVTGLTRGIARLAANAPAATARALNKSGGSMRTYMASNVAADVDLKVAVVREQLLLTAATATNPTVQLSVSGARIPLIQFNARQTRAGVRARLPTGAGLYPNAFIATMKNGHTGVFERVVPSVSRKGKRRSSSALHIFELFGPSILHVFSKYRQGALDRGQEQLVKNLAHELSFYGVQT